MRKFLCIFTAGFKYVKSNIVYGQIYITEA